MDNNISTLTIQIIPPQYKSIKITSDKAITIEDIKNKYKNENNLTENEVNNLSFWYEDDDGDKCYINKSEDITSSAKEVSPSQFLLTLHSENKKMDENKEINGNNENSENKKKDENKEINGNNENNENKNINENKNMDENKEIGDNNVNTIELLKKEISALKKSQMYKEKQIEHLNKQIEKYKMLLEQKENNESIGIIQLMKCQEDKINKRLNIFEENIIAKIENKLKQFINTCNQGGQYFTFNKTDTGLNDQNKISCNNKFTQEEQIVNQELRDKQYSTIDKFNLFLKDIFFDKDGVIKNDKFNKSNFNELYEITKKMKQNNLDPLKYFTIYKERFLNKQITTLKDEEQKEIAQKLEKIGEIVNE